MKTYLKRLKSHPGVPIAMMLTSVAVLCAIANDSTTVKQGIIVGLVASLFFWVPVLITARNQPYE